jgi:hypothetical protein
VSASQLQQPTISGDSLYLVLAPVGPSGIAILGDTNQFVTMGRKRVTAFDDRGEPRVTVTFADGESSLEITGYSPTMPSVTPIEGGIGTVTYDQTTHLFRVPVTPGSNHSATIRVHPGKVHRRPASGPAQ